MDANSPQDVPKKKVCHWC